MKTGKAQTEDQYSSKRYPSKDLTKQIIGSALEVHSHLGPGLLENLYEEALAYEFDLRKIKYERQKEIGLVYKGNQIGDHRIDFLVQGKVIVELKAVQALNSVHEAQVLTYLKATQNKVGLLINFNVEKLRHGIKRFVL